MNADAGGLRFPSPTGCGTGRCRRTRECYVPMAPFSSEMLQRVLVTFSDPLPPIGQNLDSFV